MSFSLAFLIWSNPSFSLSSPQFADLSTTSDNLFSLLNGDDIYATYRDMRQTSYALWIFSKIYLYLFITLFIYVVLNVFIGLIYDTYQTLHVSTFIAWSCLQLVYCILVYCLSPPFLACSVALRILQF